MLSGVLEEFSAQGYEPTVHPTQEGGEAARVARDEGGSFARVVCCGGDGTLNEVVSGLIGLPCQQRPVVGYIPAGSTNDFARTLGLPRSVGQMARTACIGQPRAVDVGMANQTPFVYVCAFGLFTDVAYSTPQNAKNSLGHLAYVLEGAGRLMNVPTYHMTIHTDDGRQLEEDFVFGMVSNTRSVGGVNCMPADSVKLDDGLFEVTLVRPPRSPKDWQSILATLSGQEVSQEDAVIRFSASRITFRCDQPVSWTVDGEFGGEWQEAEIENLPQAIRIACPGNT